MEIDFDKSEDDLFTTMTFAQNQTVQYVHLSKLAMKDGVQRVKVNTKNALGISSEHVFYNVSLYTLPPVRNSKWKSHVVIINILYLGILVKTFGFVCLFVLFWRGCGFVHEIMIRYGNDVLASFFNR